MKKVVKIVLSTGIALSALVGINNDVVKESNLIAHGETTQAYNIKGYSTNNGNFILDPKFIDAVRHNQFVINGYHISGNEQQQMSLIDIYDQTIAKTGEHTASMVDFEVKKDTISKEDLIKTYGQPVEPPFESAQGFDYRYNIGKNIVQFIVDGGYVKDVQINAENE
ncbi:immunodominant staphylococcal antigen IsaB family protein [Staphylococcus caeli]|uniref:immunodominant staphylococcal antigen IsaB family protein n=1 Tax=Staphylococcus caeli TaxID=2201815 RepID=UPI003F569D2E